MPPLWSYYRKCIWSDDLLRYCAALSWKLPKLPNRFLMDIFFHFPPFVWATGSDCWACVGIGEGLLIFDLDSTLCRNAARFLSKTTPQLQIQIFTGIRLIFDSDSTLLKIANPPQRIPILYQKLRLNRFPNLTWSPSDLSAVDFKLFLIWNWFFTHYCQLFLDYFSSSPESKGFQLIWPAICC